MKFLMTYAQGPNLPPPTPEKMAAIGAFAEKNKKSGVLLMTGGLVRPSSGIQLKCEGGKLSVTDGPFAETKELIDGFALIEVGSREEAIRMAHEFMQIAGDGTGEILQVFDQAARRRGDVDGGMLAGVSDAATHAAIHAVWKNEAARVVGVLARIVRDVGLAEELAQDALVAALEEWPRSGVPERPAAWLMTTAKNRALNAARRAKLVERKHDALANEAPAHLPLAALEAAIEAGMDDDIADDVLRLAFVACHPALSREARAALTLRLLGGLSTDEIARAYLVSEPTIAQRIVRAKRTLGEAGLAFEVPRGDELSARLGSVLEVVYLVFNEGYAASAGTDVMRPALVDEALRLGRLLADSAPAEPEVHGLLALMSLHASRAPARTDEHGEPVMLLDQDRTRWDAALVASGLAALDRAAELGREPGPYRLQAAIAACHARARTAGETDWAAIAGLYAELARLVPSPVVALNHAVAVSRAEGPAAGLRLLDALAAEPTLARYHLLPSARADLLERLGRRDEAAVEFDRAASLAENARQQGRLRERAAACRRRPT